MSIPILKLFVINNLVSYGGEGGIRTPDTAFDRITV